VDQSIKKIISKNSPENLLSEYLSQNKFKTISQSALQKALQGITSLEEVISI